MALPQRKYDLEESDYDAAPPLRPQGAKRARTLWWWVGSTVVCLLLWWVVWVWGGFGEWWAHRYYREGTNGGAVSEPMGQTSDEPTDVVRNPLGSTANPNTGVHGHPQADGDVPTGASNGKAENSAPGGATQNGTADGSAGSTTDSAPAAGAPPIL
jgi:hypothetical protein